MFINSKYRLVTLVMAIFAGMLLSASAIANENIKVRGFANLGLTYSNSDTFAFRNSIINSPREGLSFAADSLVGLQINAQINERLDAVGQVLLQDRFDHSITNYIQLAFLRYQINRNWSVKAGRFSTPSYLFTDYRYVGHAMTWVRAPLEMYSIVGSVGNMNGLQAAYVTGTDFGTIKISLSRGNARYHSDVEAGKFRFSYKDLTGLNIELQSNNWRAQAVYLTGEYDNTIFPGSEEARAVPNLVPEVFKPYAQELADSFIPDGKQVNYLSIGGSYSFDNIEIIAEASDYESRFGLAKSARFGYVSLSYNIDDLTPFVTLGVYSRKEAPEVIDFAKAQSELPAVLYQQLRVLVYEANRFVQAYSVDQKSLSLGLKWDFSSTWTLKAQMDHFKPNALGSGLFSIVDGLERPNTKTSYNVFNLSFTTTF